MGFAMPTQVGRVERSRASASTSGTHAASMSSVARPHSPTSSAPEPATAASGSPPGAPLASADAIIRVVSPWIAAPTNAKLQPLHVTQRRAVSLAPASVCASAW